MKACTFFGHKFTSFGFPFSQTFKSVCFSLKTDLFFSIIQCYTEEKGGT